MLNCFGKLALDTDISTTFFPDAEDVELIRKPGHEYMMGRLPNGKYVVKSITYFGGWDTSFDVIAMSLSMLGKQQGISRDQALTELKYMKNVFADEHKKDIARVVLVLKKHEDTLTDGYEFYGGDEGLLEVADAILDALSQAERTEGDQNGKHWRT